MEHVVPLHAVSVLMRGSPAGALAALALPQVHVVATEGLGLARVVC